MLESEKCRDSSSLSSFLVHSWNESASFSCQHCEQSHIKRICQSWFFLHSLYWKLKVDDSGVLEWKYISSKGGKKWKNLLRMVNILCAEILFFIYNRKALSKVIIAIPQLEAKVNPDTQHKRILSFVFSLWSLICSFVKTNQGKRILDWNVRSEIIGSSGVRSRLYFSNLSA